MGQKYEYAIGKQGRVVAARILPDADLIDSIEKLCKENNIKYASINCCIGSLKETGFFYLKKDNNSKLGFNYSDKVQLKGYIEFLNGMGIICQNKGEYETHFHGTVCHENEKLYGGHFVKGENIILTTMDIIITEILDVDLLREYDDKTGFLSFMPRKGTK